MKATLKNARISPKKLRVVANLVRGKSVNDGLAMLRLFSKKGGDILYKVLFSAASNAIHNDGAAKDDLKIHYALYRSRPYIQTRTSSRSWS
jgi:large subunit ribosomal protein L22